MADIIRLNAQGMSRRSESLMRCVTARPGYTFISSDMCYPTESTRFLTKSGWKFEPEIQDGEEIWQVDSSSLKGSWAVPTRRISYKFTGNLVTYVSKRGSLVVTEGHKMLWVGQVNHPTRPDKANWRRVTYAGVDETLLAIQHLCHFSHSDTVSNYSVEDLWKACLLQADGSIESSKTNRYRIEVSRPRKRDKITDLFGQGKVASSIRPKQTMLNESWRVQYSHPLLEGKDFDLSTLGANQADEFVSALAFWDGHQSRNNSRTGRVSFSSVNLRVIEEVQSYLVRSGYECSVSIQRPATTRHKACYKLSIRKCGVTRWITGEHIAPSGVTTQSLKSYQEVIDYPVSCFEVASGFLLVEQKGQTFVSGNCSGEPTVTAHYSRDMNYLLATQEMVGKEPYYNTQGMLVISDIYLMVASRAPMWAKDIRDAYEATYDGLTFGQMWVKDSEYIAKKVLKRVRDEAKTLALALAYEVGPKKMVMIALQAGYELTLKQAKDFFAIYWETFPNVKKLRNKWADLYRSQGHIMTEFGYCLYPSEDYKVMNAVIQSTVSGVISYLCMAYFEDNPWVLFSTIIHDEVIFEVPIDRLDEAKRIYFEAVDKLNKDLGWSVPIQFGWKEGKDFYEAK